ncbi:MAG: MarR family transcriptional regulator [Bacteriovorax sp.]|nr:MarR family transcriptional regulator [Bacteriovorax sp.]
MTKKITKTKKNDICHGPDLNYETTVHPGLKNFFGYSLYKAGVIYRELSVHRHAHLHNLNNPECGVLYVLCTGAVTNQLTLGQDLGIDKATIVKIIDKLEQLNFVKREVDPTDRRSKLLSITPKGKKILDKIASVKKEVEELIFKDFSKEEKDQLTKLVPKLLEVLINLK